MAGKRIEYQIVGRYMDGKEVTGYHLQSIDNGKSGRYTKEQVCYLVGRGQVTNCTGQLYQDKVLLRGNGMSLEDLPVQYEDGGSRNMEQLGRVRKGTSAEQAMTQFLIVGAIKSGRNTIGYVIQNAGSGIKKVKRQQVVELAQAGRIGNARVQNYNGKLLLRGVGCNLDELPVEMVEAPVEAKGVINKAPNSVSNTSATREIKKEPTSRIVNISQVYYNGRQFSVALVDFAVYNPSLTRPELEAELRKFMDKAREGIGHRFGNTSEMYELNIKGKNCLAIFDDPYLNSLGEYAAAASRIGAKFVVDKRVVIMDENGNELEGSAAHEAMKALVKRVNMLRQV